MKVDIFNTDKNYSIIYADPPWKYGGGKKPNETRDRIVQLMGDLARVELFARQQTEGWDCWGNEV